MTQPTMPDSLPSAGERLGARGAYIRWLGRRFRDLDLMQSNRLVPPPL